MELTNKEEARIRGYEDGKFTDNFTSPYIVLEDLPTLKEMGYAAQSYEDFKSAANKQWGLSIAKGLKDPS